MFFLGGLKRFFEFQSSTWPPDFRKNHTFRRVSDLVGNISTFLRIYLPGPAGPRVSCACDQKGGGWQERPGRRPAETLLCSRDYYRHPLQNPLAKIRIGWGVLEYVLLFYMVFWWRKLYLLLHTDKHSPWTQYMYQTQYTKGIRYDYNQL